MVRRRRPAGAGPRRSPASRLRGRETRGRPFDTSSAHCPDHPRGCGRCRAATPPGWTSRPGRFHGPSARPPPPETRAPPRVPWGKYTIVKEDWVDGDLGRMGEREGETIGYLSLGAILEANRALPDLATEPGGWGDVRSFSSDHWSRWRWTGRVGAPRSAARVAGRACGHRHRLSSRRPGPRPRQGAR